MTLNLAIINVLKFSGFLRMDASNNVIQYLNNVFTLYHFLHVWVHICLFFFLHVFLTLTAYVPFLCNKRSWSAFVDKDDDDDVSLYYKTADSSHYFTITEYHSQYTLCLKKSM